MTTPERHRTIEGRLQLARTRGKIESWNMVYSTNGRTKWHVRNRHWEDEYLTTREVEAFLLGCETIGWDK